MCGESVGKPDRKRGEWQVCWNVSRRGRRSGTLQLVKVEYLSLPTWPLVGFDNGLVKGIIKLVEERYKFIYT